MLKKILLALVAIIAAFAVFVATRPNQYTVERSAMVAAPADVIYPHLEDLHKWAAWSPWDKLDPAMKKEFSGAEKGVGAIYHWTSNQDNVGEGQMTITSVKANEMVEIKLEFIKPFESLATTSFTLAPNGDKTKVTWTMAGNNNFVGKAMGLFMNMDKMIGDDFEKGLATLTTTAEADAKAKAEAEAKAKAEAESAAAAAAAAAAGGEMPANNN